MITTDQMQRAVNLVMTSNGRLTCGQALDRILSEDARHPITAIFGTTEITINGTGSAGDVVVIVPVRRREPGAETHATINGVIGCDRVRQSQTAPAPTGARVTCATCTIAMAEAKGEL